MEWRVSSKQIVDQTRLFNEHSLLRVEKPVLLKKAGSHIAYTTLESKLNRGADNRGGIVAAFIDDFVKLILQFQFAAELRAGKD